MPSREELGASLRKLAANDRSLDFGRAFPDAVDTHIAAEPFDGVLAHIAAPAENLHRLIEHAAGHFGGVELDHAGVRVRDLAIDVVVDLPCDTIDHALGRHDLDGHVREHEFNGLVATD